MFAKEYGKTKGRILKSLGLEPAHNADPASNGEYAFLRFVAGLPEAARADTIIDVGANVGEWTAEAMRIFGGSAVSRFICVEPVPSFLAQLRERYTDVPRVEILDVALSNHPESQREIFEISGGGRMYRHYHGLDAGDVKGKTTVVHKVRVTTGDEVFADYTIKPLLLKIDCDGHDGHILAGFREVLRRHRPLVQFEYCDFWIAAGSRLRDICQILYGEGYSSYKIFPDRLVQFHAKAIYETFCYQNIVGIPPGVVATQNSTIRFSPS
jgi:FkbM family methyltransferase